MKTGKIGERLFLEEHDAAFFTLPLRLDRSRDVGKGPRAP